MIYMCITAFPEIYNGSFVWGKLCRRACKQRTYLSVHQLRGARHVVICLLRCMMDDQEGGKRSSSISWPSRSVAGQMT